MYYTGDGNFYIMQQRAQEKGDVFEPFTIGSFDQWHNGFPIVHKDLMMCFG